MSIVLYPVAQIDLSVKYSRDMGNKKLRYYSIPAVLIVINKLTGQDLEEVLREFIVKTEGVKPEEITFADTTPDVGFGEWAPTGPQDVSPIVLQKDRAIGRALLKMKSPNMLYQYAYYPSRFSRTLDTLSHIYNFFVPMVNRVMYRLQGVDFSLGYNTFVRQLGLLSTDRSVRACTPVSHISVAFEAEDSVAALEALRSDLRILYKKKLIMGHYAMPSILRLDNLTGMGKYYTLFCFPFIDTMRLQKITGKTPLEWPSLKLNELLGLKYETNEGGVRWLNDVKPEDKFESVEFVNVFDSGEDARRQAVVESYNASKEHVNSIAKDMKKTLSEMKKVESRTYGVGTSSGVKFQANKGVSVNVSLQHTTNHKTLELNGSAADKVVDGVPYKGDYGD